MSNQPSERIPQPPRAFGSSEEPLFDVDNDTFAADSGVRPRGSSTGFRINRPSRSPYWRTLADEETASLSVSERPPIPSALAPTGENATTPLPALPMLVLSIVMLGEFLTANVSMPFLLFMVEGFGGLHSEAEVGYWTGILVSCFFITQFITSLLWATAADKHGVRNVLFVSLLGSSFTCMLFGSSTSLSQAMAIRLLQGVFAGAIGVGRGNVVAITDPSNEGRAYAILGFCWGFGGVAGAIIGGSFESPAKKWPNTFQRFTLFVKFPYLLPTIIAASITFMGAIVCLFLAPDGGPREGAIRLPPEKISTVETIPEESGSLFSDEDETSGFVGRLKHKVSKLSGLFHKRSGVLEGPSHQADSGNPPMPLSTSMRRSNSLNRTRTFSTVTSRANGSAYGYGNNYRNRLASNASNRSLLLAGRRGSLASIMARRRGSHAQPQEQQSTAGEPSGELNFAQRLLMANELQVTNLSDLWVAAAMNADNEEVFVSDSDYDFDDEVFQDDEIEEDLLPQTPTRLGRTTGRSFTALTHASNIHTPSPGRPRGDSSTVEPPSANRTGIPFRKVRTIEPSQNIRGGAVSRSAPLRMSRTLSIDQGGGHSGRRSSAVPAIFSHTGVREPPALVDPSLHHRESRDSGLGTGPPTTSGEALAPIIEGHSTQTSEVSAVSEKPPSIFSQLPIMIILQYGLLALHSTTHDQVFLSYLVSKYQNGGLNLNAGNFAQLIALMSLASIAYQFYLYPNLGPPRGRFSHLSMFRLGSLLFIPAYLSVILYRPLASAGESGSVFLMGLLALSTAIRYAGITFAYTAVAILLNYTAPPHLLGIANGIAQSIVSFARFVGPILGGYLWSVSVAGNPSGYPFGFLVCSVVTVVAVSASFLIR